MSPRNTRPAGTRRPPSERSDQAPPRARRVAEPSPGAASRRRPPVLGPDARLEVHVGVHVARVVKLELLP
eukprot:7692065-Alexandrium_andersonii.AAC.1